jgi:hypothetical protein
MGIKATELDEMREKKHAETAMELRPQPNSAGSKRKRKRTKRR